MHEVTFVKGRVTEVRA